MVMVTVPGGTKIRTHTGKLVGRKGGKPFKSKKEALKRERQMSYFKHKNK